MKMAGDRLLIGSYQVQHKMAASDTVTLSQKEITITECTATRLAAGYPLF